MKTLVLFGFKGSGKTYWGKKLAQELQCPFLDTDRLLEARHAERYGQECTCREIYKMVGEKRFRELEGLVLATIEKKTPCIIALGGGTILCKKNRALLQKMGTLVYLKAAKETLKKRAPPFYVGASFEDVYNQRLPVFEEIVAHRVEVEGSEGDVLSQLKELAHGK